MRAIAVPSPNPSLISMATAVSKSRSKIDSSKPAILSARNKGQRASILGSIL